MSWQHIIQTVAEIALATLILYGVLKREKLIALEAPIKAKIKKAVIVWLQQIIARRALK